MKAFITGVGGFVGSYLSDLVLSKGVAVFGTDIVSKPDLPIEYFQGDITDADVVREMIASIRPDYIFHLAGLSSVKLSFEKPDLTQTINVGGTKNLLDAVGAAELKPKIVIVSSAEVYGDKSEALSESDPVDGSTSPYAQSRLDQEALCRDFSDLSIAVSRSFNHTGPGQPDVFVAASFAKQVAEISLGMHEPVMQVGNLEVIRDFSDVRDVVQAYWLLSQGEYQGEIFNIGSGRGISIRHLLDTLVSLADIQVKIEIDPERYRPAEKPVLICNKKKFIERTGWEQSFKLEQTLKDMLEYWRRKLR